MFHMIKDAETLNKRIQLLGTSGKRHTELLHETVISVLAHVATHGNPAPLNHLFGTVKSYSPNEADAIRLYVGMVARKRPDTAFLNFSVRDGGFTVKTGVTKERKAFAELAETKLLNPDGKEWLLFNKMNNIKEDKKQRIITDETVAKNVARLLGSIKQPGKDVLVEVSSKMLAAVEAALSSLEDVAGQNYEAADVTEEDRAAFQAEFFGEAPPKTKAPPKAKAATGSGATAH